MSWRILLGGTAALFGVGVGVGYLAQQRGVPRDQVGRFVLKESLRAGLRVYDQVRDLVPDDEPVPLAEALLLPPPGRDRGQA